MSTHLLLVEDDPLLRKAFTTVFTKENFTVTTAENGKEALDFLRSTQKLPDVIILDLLMPVMSGLEFLQLYRAETALQNIKILILSNLSDEKTIQTLKKYKNETYTLKSNVSPRQLVSAVRAIL